MKKKRPFFLFLLSAGLFFLIILSCTYLFFALTDLTVSQPDSRNYRSAAHNDQEVNRNSDAGHTTQPVTDFHLQQQRPKVAIIIDDLGQNHDIDLLFVELNLPLSLAILPSATFTDLVVREATRRGREILLHQPMEPKDYPCVKPGMGALLLSMNEGEIREMLDRNLIQVAGARGINNHMGSSFTESRKKMSMVLRELKRRGLFFVDSRTSKESVGYEQAKRIGLPAAQRTVFLDNSTDPEDINRQIEHLFRIARRLGTAIGIGHPYRQTLEILYKRRDILLGEADMVPVSGLVR